MKAYKLQWVTSKAAGKLELWYRYALPQISCPVCHRTWGNDFYEYPAINCEFFNEKEFNIMRQVNVAEFAVISKRIQNSIGSSLLLVPGGSLGLLEGKSITTRLEDFAWGRVCYPQVSKRACELLQKQGINLVTAEMFLRCRGRNLDSHWALQVAPLALLTSNSLQANKIQHCPVCGDYHLVENKPSLGRYQLRASLWPKGQHLVTLAETVDVIASPEFMAAVQKHPLTGIRFVECGEFV